MPELRWCLRSPNGVALGGLTVHLSGQFSWIPGIRHFGAVAFVLLTSAAAQTAPIPEYQAKASYVLNFAQFVRWPSQSSNTPFVIGILGDDPFGSYLDETVRGEKVNDRPLVIQRFRRRDDPRTCNLLFISQSERDRVTQILSSLKGRPILTVSEIDGFTDLGGMIQLFTEKNSIRMRINVDAVKAANLRVSSKLMRMAEVAR